MQLKHQARRTCGCVGGVNRTLAEELRMRMQQQQNGDTVDEFGAAHRGSLACKTKLIQSRHGCEPNLNWQTNTRVRRGLGGAHDDERTHHVTSSHRITALARVQQAALGGSGRGGFWGGSISDKRVRWRLPLFPALPSHQRCRRCSRGWHGAGRRKHAGGQAAAAAVRRTRSWTATCRGSCSMRMHGAQSPLWRRISGALVHRTRTSVGLPRPTCVH